MVDAPVVAIVPPEKSFPAWSGWDVLAICVFSAVCLLVFIGAGLLASGILAAPRNMKVTDLARDAHMIRIFLAAQALAYLVIFGCIFLVVRSRGDSSFAQAIQWNWPGMAVLKFFVGGILLALAVDALSRYLPMPKSLPMEDLFTNRTNAYLLAAFGLTLAPVMEELFFRGLLYPILRRSVALGVSIPLVGLAVAAIYSTLAGHAWTPTLTMLFVLTIFAVALAAVGRLYRPVRGATGLLLLVASASLGLAAIRAAWAGHAWNPLLTMLSIFSILVLGASLVGLRNRRLWGAVGLMVAIISTSLGFAAIHGTQLGYAWAPLLSIFMVSIVFTLLREWRNSVAASFVMHCGYNFTLFSMLWYLSDHFRHLEKVSG